MKDKPEVAVIDMKDTPLVERVSVKVNINGKEEEISVPKDRVEQVKKIWRGP